MKLYASLSKIGFLKKYSYKFLFVAFIGIHVPLISIIVMVVTKRGEQLQPGMVILIVLIFTLLATGVTLFFLNRLLDPLIKSKDALENYIDNNELPDLPTGFSDEAGNLMHRLQSTLFELDGLIKSKDDLVSLLSHDLRTPVSHIISYAELLNETREPEQIHKFSQQIVKAGNEQLEMLESILNLLRHQGLQISIESLTPQSLDQMIGTAINNVSDEYEEKNLTIHNSITPGLKLLVKADLFEHALQNILNNAAKFSHKGGQVNIDAKQSGDKVLIQIKDQGMGFEPSDSELIFKRFTQKGKRGTSGETSTGLGLYISRSIVEKHNGKLYAKSQGKDKGAIFSIEIPA